MGVEGLHCCAVGELYDLSDYNSPMSAMKAFCHFYGDYHGDPDDPGAFIIFTGVVRFTSDSDNYGDDTTYGPKFASFIRKHRLGSVVSTKPVRNRNNEPDHYVKVWVWAPNYKELKKWWTKNKDK